MDLPGGGARNFVDVLALLTQAPQLSGPDHPVIGDAELALLVLDGSTDPRPVFAALQHRYARVRAITCGRLDLRVGALHSLVVDQALEGIAHADEVDPDRVGDLHGQAHEALDRWHTFVDRAGIATLDLYREHWSRSPLDVAALVCRWLGSEPDGDAASELVAAWPEEAETPLPVMDGLRRRLPCQRCDETLDVAHRLSLLETWSLAD